MFSQELRVLYLRVKALLLRRRLEQDLDDEIHFHLAMAAERSTSPGTSSAAAEQQARCRFGNPTLLRESARQVWTFRLVEEFWQDFF